MKVIVVAFRAVFPVPAVHVIGGTASLADYYMSRKSCMFTFQWYLYLLK